MGDHGYEGYLCPLLFFYLKGFYASVDKESIDGIESFLCCYYNMPKCNKNMSSCKPIECNPPIEIRR